MSTRNANSRGHRKTVKPRGGPTTIPPPPLPCPSDLDEYDSDTPVAPIQIPSSTLTADQLNLAVLRRHAPETTSIVAIAPFTVVYTYSPSLESWEKTGVEGSLFVCNLQPSSTAGNRSAVTILNRRGLENFHWELKRGGDVESTGPDFIILHAAPEGGEVKTVGLWIFSEPNVKMGENITKVLADCAAKAEASRTNIVVTPVAATNTGQHGVSQQRGRGPGMITTQSDNNPSTPTQSASNVDILERLRYAVARFKGCDP